MIVRSGSVFLTIGSGSRSGRPKNIQNRTATLLFYHYYIFSLFLLLSAILDIRHLHWLMDWCLNLLFRHPCVCSWHQVPEESCLAACWKPCRGKYVLPIFSSNYVILKLDSTKIRRVGKEQCCGTVTIYYGSGSGSGSDFWKVMVPVPVPVLTFEKLWFRFRFLLLKKLRFRFRFQLHI